MRCVNCQWRIARLWRHRLSDESAQVVARIQKWDYTRDMTGDDFICHPCWELINHNPKEDPEHNTQQQLGHSNVCAGCGRSILRIRSRLVFRPEMSEREVQIGNIVSEWIRPRQLTNNDEICVPCYLRAQKVFDSSHRSSAPVASNIEFPELTIEDLELIALRTYQIKQAKSYAGERLRAHGMYTLEVCQNNTPLEGLFNGSQPLIIRGRIKSRHIGRSPILHTLELIESWRGEVPY